MATREQAIAIAELVLQSNGFVSERTMAIIEAISENGDAHYESADLDFVVQHPEAVTSELGPWRVVQYVRLIAQDEQS